MFDLSSSPLNIDNQAKGNQQLQSTDGKRREPRAGSTSSDLDFSLKTEEEYERETKPIKKTSADSATSSFEGGGSLNIPGKGVDADQTSGNSPPSSCDSGVVLDAVTTEIKDARVLVVADKSNDDGERD